MDQAVDAVPGGRVFGVLGRITDRIAPFAVGGAVFVVSAAGLQGSLGVEWSSAVTWGLAACCAVCGVVAGLARYTLWPLFVAAAVGWVVLLVWPPAMVAAYYAGTRLRGRRPLAFLVGALACWVVSVVVNATIGGYRAFWTTTGNSLVTLLVFMGLPLVVGLWINARRQLLAQLRDRADRLEREQAERAERARVTERARIAREMHDILAHRVSLMVLHAGAIEVNTTDGRLAGEAGLIRSTGRDALVDLREVLGVLRAPAETAPQPTLSDLPALLDASRAAGLPVEHRVEGEPVPLPDVVQRTAYRVVQEALTNVHKHAGRAATEVVLRHQPGRLTVTVRNAPPAEPVTAPVTSGLGLTGLRERVALLGGTSRADADDDGFTVRADLPIASAAADDGFTVRADLPASTAADPAGDDRTAMDGRRMGVAT